MYQYKKNGYIISAVPNDSGVSTYWISKEGNTDVYYCFSASDDTERDYQIQNGFDAYVAMYEQNHTRLFGRDFDIQTPLGALHVYSKHEADNPKDFPGVYIDLKETGDMLACVEYDSVNHTMQTCVYQPGQDTPVEVVIHNMPTDDDDSDDE